MINIFNTYNRNARLFPAIICSFPFLLIKFVIVDRYIDAGITAKFLTLVVGGVTVWVALVYFIAQINRFVAKTFFEDKNNFPTLKMLLPSSKNVSEIWRNKIKEKILNDFQVLLPNLHDEETDLSGTKTRIKEIVGMIIHRVGNGKLVLQHNAEYGFVRNLIGGSTIAVFVCICSAFLFHYLLKNNSAFIISVILLICYLIPIIFSRSILKNYSEEYASILFREYLGS